MDRSISEKFLDDLISGSLSDIRKKILQDDTLMLDLRGESIMVYYRGGKLLEIEECGKSYKFKNGDKKYIVTNIVIPKVIFSKEGSCDISLIENYISVFKYNIDIYFGGIRNNEKRDKRHSLENEIRQHIVRENNYTRNANSTDYFIIDTEYETTQKKKFDIVAIEWEADISSRKLQKGYQPKLVIFELKYGEDAIGEKCGLNDHLRDFNNFMTNTEEVACFKEDMLKVLNQKRQLGLIPYLKWNNKNEIKAFNDDIDFIFLIANYNKRSTKLMNEIKNMDKFKMLTSSYLGYGLYKNNLVDKSILKDYDPNHP